MKMQRDEMVVNQRDEVVLGWVALVCPLGRRIWHACLGFAFQLRQINVMPTTLLHKKPLDQQADADPEQIRVVARDLSRRFDDGEACVVMEPDPLLIEAMPKVQGFAKLSSSQAADAINQTRHIATLWSIVLTIGLNDLDRTQEKADGNPSLGNSPETT
jgi:hypothetical protein